MSGPTAVDRVAIAAIIAAGAATLGVTLDEAQLSRLVAYVELVQRWQHVTNLTGATDPRRFAVEHVVDCLALVPYIGREHVVDVGSGAGLPGIVLAVACPDSHLTLVEPRARRARFLTQARIELALDNVDVRHARVEDVEIAPPCDIVVSRALGSLVDFLAATVHLAGPTTRVIAMKGVLDRVDLAAAEACGGPATIVALEVPGRVARHLVVFHPATGPGRPAGAARDVP
ncbi:MAG: 16S rRNA (guanine(527)-N(7))-methyltransferase RsmG [Gammaproteobacteria bacterium]